MRKNLLFILLAWPVFALAQSWKANPVSLSIFNNATMLPPASLVAVFNQPIHPGFTAGYEFGWKKEGKHKWFQNAGFSYFYHRFVYQAIILNSQAGYRWHAGNFSAEGYLQVGYMHAFYLTDRAVKQSDGSYMAKKGFGKPQFVNGLGAGVGYNFGETNQLRRIFLDYDFRLQMPFVQNYVTLLPNGTLSLGIQLTLN